MSARFNKSFKRSDGWNGITKTFDKALDFSARPGDKRPSPQKTIAGRSGATAAEQHPPRGRALVFSPYFLNIVQQRCFPRSRVPAEGNSDGGEGRSPSCPPNSGNVRNGCVYPFHIETSNHLLGNRRDSIKHAQQPSLQVKSQTLSRGNGLGLLTRMLHPPKILYVQPSLAPDQRATSNAWGAQNNVGSTNSHQVGMPSRLQQHDCRLLNAKTREMNQSF